MAVERGQADPRTCRRRCRKRRSPSSTARRLFTATELDFRHRSLRCRHRRLGRHAAAQGHPQPARPRSRSPRPTSTPTRSSGCTAISRAATAIVLSVHPHNDRGTGVAAAELGLMAGADRVEGCLFGNGERTGNVDLVTLALNLYTQGVHPGLDFSDINEVARTRRALQPAADPSAPPVRRRSRLHGVLRLAPGRDQEGVRRATRRTTCGTVPYLPIDPADVGRSYDSVIRVNSQSGKGGIAYLLETEYGLELPRRLQIEFSQVVQAVTDDTGKEVTAAQIKAIFDARVRPGGAARGARRASSELERRRGERAALSCWRQTVRRSRSSAPATGRSTPSSRRCTRMSARRSACSTTTSTRSPAAPMPARLPTSSCASASAPCSAWVSIATSLPRRSRRSSRDCAAPRRERLCHGLSPITSNITLQSRRSRWPTN